MRITIGRFPKELTSQEFLPTAYNLNSAGLPGYHVVIKNGQYTPDEKPYDVYVVSGTYRDGNLVLSRNDGEEVNVNIDNAVGWFEGE